MKTTTAYYLLFLIRAKLVNSYLLATYELTLPIKVGGDKPQKQTLEDLLNSKMLKIAEIRRILITASSIMALSGYTLLLLGIFSRQTYWQISILGLIFGTSLILYHIKTKLVQRENNTLDKIVSDFNKLLSVKGIEIRDLQKSPPELRSIVEWEIKELVTSLKSSECKDSFISDDTNRMRVNLVRRCFELSKFGVCKPLQNYYHPPMVFAIPSTDTEKIAEVNQ